MTPTHVLFGGSSSERRVSTASAQNILQNLEQADAWFLSRDGSVFLCARDEVLGHRDPFQEEFRPGPNAKALFRTIDEAARAPELKQALIVLALHGLGVEDGKLQLKLEKAGVAFTGSGARASALAFDKLSSKKIAIEQGARTALYQVLQPTDAVEKTLLSCIRRHERVALKPVADGSSVGLHVLDSRSDLAAVAQHISAEGRAYLIEEFIAGTELTVGVVGDGEAARALPPSEVRMDDGSNFDYDAKYLGKGVEELTPARVSVETTRAAQELALTMHRALECEGYSRTDMIVNRDGPVYLETNTLPGMTKASFFPQQLVAHGSTLQEFLENEIERAWKRTHGQLASLNSSRRKL